MTRMGRIMDTTLFVKNGPCMASLGLGGEGYLSFSIAGPTGEGVTTPLTFTRERRCSLIDDLCLLGKPKRGRTGVGLVGRAREGLSLALSPQPRPCPSNSEWWL